MQKDHEADVENFMNGLIKRNPNESEFHQAVRKVVETLWPFIMERRDWLFPAASRPGCLRLATVLLL